MRKCLSQEWLKVIACLTMLTDHVGAVFFPRLYWLRIVGRLAFPVYCFLLAEGIAHTKSPRKYGIRLLIGAALSELSFDYLFFGGITLAHQSVMVTLIIGFLMLLWMKKLRNFAKILPLAVCFLIAELACCDYGGWGIGLIWVFAIAREEKHDWIIRIAGMGLIFWLMDSGAVFLGPLYVPIQMFALISLLPIALYSGQKRSHSPWLQRSFYLFYPVHLTVLLMISLWME